jgi:transposase InsO family protein
VRGLHLCPPARIQALLHPGEEPGTRNGVSEAFLATLKRDYVQIIPLPDAASTHALIGAWFENYNNHHPHSGLRMRSPREFI